MRSPASSARSADVLLRVLEEVPRVRGVRSAGLDLEEMLDVRDGATVVALHDARVAADVPGLGEPRLDLDRLRAVGVRPVQVSLLAPHLGAGDPGGAASRVELDGLRA